MLADLRYALRALGRVPGFTVTAVACLALGIGANATVFSVVDGLLLRPLPYHEPERLVSVTQANDVLGMRDIELSLPIVEDVRAGSRTLAGVAAISTRFVTLASGAQVEGVEAAQVTSRFFDVLGVTPLVGRGFRDDDAVPGAAPSVVLGEGLWRGRFGGDPAIVGRTVLLDGAPRVVLGVMPSRAAMTAAHERLWLVHSRPADSVFRGDRSYAGIARLAPGATMAQADAELRAMGERFAAAWPASDRGWSLYAIPLREQMLSREASSISMVMMGAVAFVLLIACANVANLLLVRGTARARELAVRTALGAARARVVRQLLAESVVLALAGGGIGVLVARGGVAWISGQVRDVPAWITFAVDWRVVAFVGAVSLATAVVVGLVPALRTTGLALAPVLRDGGRGASAGAGGRRLRDGLVVAELALSLVLLAGAGLMVRSFLSLQQASPGFDANGLTVAQYYTGGARYADDASRVAFADALVERARRAPGVTDAAVVTSAPLDGRSSSSGYVVEGKPMPPGEEPSTEFRGVSAGYLRTMRIPLLAGRDFTDAEARDSNARVLLVNDRLAERAWPGQSAIGRRISVAGGDNWYTVVGVVGTVQQRVNRNRRPGAQLYFPYAAASRRGATLVVRGGDPLALAPLIGREVRAIDAGVPLLATLPYPTMVRRSLMEPRVFGALFGAFAAVALGLAVIGVYGVITYAVATRTRELGVRIALGASVRDVYALVMRQGGTLVVAGLGIGIVAALGLTRLLRGVLYGVSASDPVVFTGVVAMLAASALVATWLPARRAARVDPAITLRGE